jgi:hypothetical protein
MPHLHDVSYKITVNNDLTTEEMVAAGHYDDIISRHITTPNFWHYGSGKSNVVARIVAVKYVTRMSGPEVRDLLLSRNLVLADVAELLAFGAQHREVQRRCRIIALGDIWTDPQGNRSAACLGENSSRRYLDMILCDGNWRTNCQFLTVRRH